MSDDPTWQDRVRQVAAQKGIIPFPGEGEQRFFQRAYFTLRQFWINQGFSSNAARIITKSGCETLKDIQEKGELYFQQLPYCGTKICKEISSIIGGWSPPATGERWARELSFVPTEILLAELERRRIIDKCFDINTKDSDAKKNDSGE